MLPQAEIKRLGSLSDNALRAELGRAILKGRSEELLARPPSVRALIAEANAWLVAEHAKLHGAICRNATVRAIATSEPSPSEKLIRVVADAISSLTLIVPIATVAEILVRDGIPKYCEAIWSDHSPKREHTRA